MSPGPVEDTPHQAAICLWIVPEAVLQEAGLFLGEVGEVNRPPDVEGGQADVLYEVGGSGDAEQAEGQALPVRVQGAGVVAEADGREELVRRERQAADVVDLIHEDHDLAGDALQDDL